MKFEKNWIILIRAFRSRLFSQLSHFCNKSPQIVTFLHQIVTLLPQIVTFLPKIVTFLLKIVRFKQKIVTFLPKILRFKQKIVKFLPKIVRFKQKIVTIKQKNSMISLELIEIEYRVLEYSLIRVREPSEFFKNPQGVPPRYYICIVTRLFESRLIFDYGNNNYY